MELVAWVGVARQSILTVENFYGILALDAELRNIFCSKEDVYFRNVKLNTTPQNDGYHSPIIAVKSTWT